MSDTPEARLPEPITVYGTVAVKAVASEVVLVPRIGLQLPDRLAFEKWVGIGRRLAAVSTSAAWCLGDWLTYGEEAYSGRYRDAIEQTGLDYQTLRNYAWVTRRFSLSRRRDTLSFGHHAEVAALPQPEQDFWLRKAGELSWSRNRLRREVRASLNERSSAADLDEAGACDEGRGALDGQSIRVELTTEQARLYAEVAANEGLSIEQWAAAVLDSFVRHIRRAVGS